MGDPVWGGGVRRSGALEKRVGEKCGMIKQREEEGEEERNPH